jgi:indole-3-acetate monooxygenase
LVVRRANFAKLERDGANLSTKSLNLSAKRRSGPSGIDNIMKTDFVLAAENLIPMIRGLRHTTENDRRVAAPIVQAVRESGMCRMLLDTGEPPRHEPEEWLKVLETLAGAEASVSWLVWNNTMPCLWARFLKSAGRARVFEGARFFAGSTRPTGRAVPANGGYRISGRWTLVSGCEMADYLHLLSLVYEDGAPRMLPPGRPALRGFFLPKGSYTILDTWHSGGLRGSGSHDVVVDDVLVPEEESFAPAPPAASESPLSQLPIIPVMIAGLGAQLLGMARAAIAATIEVLQTKVSVDPGASIRERPALFIDIASSVTAVAAAESHLHASMAAMWAQVQHRLPTAADRAALYSAGLYASSAARSAILAMHTAAGTTGLYVDCPLERITRDLLAMETHIAMNPIWSEDSGRVMMGQEPVNPLYMI